MKKIFSITFAIAALCVVSCKKGDDGADIDRSGFTVFGVDTEEIELVPGERVSEVWKTGDRLSVFGTEQGNNVPYELKRSGAGKREAVFYGPVVKGDVLAAFPYQEGLALEEGQMPFTIPSVQAFDASADNATWFRRHCPTTLADASGVEQALHFRYPAGLLEVQIRFDEVVNVVAMTLSANRGISGRLLAAAGCVVNPSDVSSAQISQYFDGLAVPSRIGDRFTSFRFVLPPADFGAGSLSLKVVTTEEEFSVAFPAVTIRRVAGCDFAVASVQVNASGIPVFSLENGYLE